MIDFFNLILIIVLLVGSFWFAYMSSILVGEKKARYKAGTHDYYDNPIKGNKDAKNVASSATQQKSATVKATKTGLFDKSKIKYRDGDNT